jgi:hypothetical protein
MIAPFGGHDMRSTTTLVLALVLAVIACGGETANLTPAVAAPSAGSVSLEKSPDSGQVDRVGPDDGALKPDGNKDLSFVVNADGPVAAIFLVSVDDQSKPNGEFQADTIVGSNESPKELGAKPGKGTSGLGVFEGDKMLNAADGSLTAIGAGPHRVVVYVASNGAIHTGTKLRVYVQRPDKSLVAGGTVTN